MLEFNPYFRKKPEDLLNYKIFDDLKKSHPEWLVPPPNPIILDFDKKKAFDYEKSQFVQLTTQDLKDLLQKEVDYVQKASSYFEL